MKVKLMAAVRKWTVILNSAGGMRDCCVVRENGGHTFCLSPRDFCLGLLGKTVSRSFSPTTIRHRHLRPLFVRAYNLHTHLSL